MDHQQQDFFNRMRRVAHRAPRSTFHDGPAETRAQQRNRRLNEMLERNKAEARGYTSDPRLKTSQIAAWVLALALGVLAAFLARFLRFQVTGNPASTSPDIEFALDVIAAIFVAFLIREALSLSAVKRIGAQFAGILLAMFTMHNAVHAMPSTFEGLFSRDWVQHVQQTTRAGTFNVLGRSYDI